MVVNTEFLKKEPDVKLGDEISRVDGLNYAWNVLRSSLLARAQALGFVHDPKFDCRPAGDG